MGNCKIGLDDKSDKFLVETKKDVTLFGWKTEKKFESYKVNISPWNLRDLFRYSKSLGLEIDLDPSVEPIFDRLRNELKEYVDAAKIKCMPIDEINQLWEEEGFPFLFPKVKADDHQKKMVLWLLKVRKGACYMEQGLGKTLVGILTIGKLLHDGLIKKPLIFAPLSLLDNTAWFGDLQKFTDYMAVDLRIDKDCAMENEFNFINYDKLHQYCFKKTSNGEMSYDDTNYFEEQKFDAIFFDESSSLITHSSYRSKAFIKISRFAKYLMLASGTPSPSNIFQIWTQMRSMGSVLGDNFPAFELRYGYPKSVGPTTKYFPRQGVEQEIRKRIDLASYFVTKDVIELPTREVINVDVELHPDHRALYDKIEKDFIASVKGVDENGNTLEGDAKVDYEITMRMKLMQIISGFVDVEDSDGNIKRISLPWNAKLDKLDEIVQSHLKENEDNHVVIWCTFRHEVKTIFEKYKSISTFIYGGMTDIARKRSLKKWLSSPSCRIMISIPKASKFGHTWIKANAAIYFSATENFEDYSQSRDRIHRRGQTRKVVEYKLISKGTVERKVWLAIATKKRLDQFLKEYALNNQS